MADDDEYLQTRGSGRTDMAAVDRERDVDEDGGGRRGTRFQTKRVTNILARDCWNAPDKLA